MESKWEILTQVRRSPGHVAGFQKDPWQKKKEKKIEAQAVGLFSGLSSSDPG